MGKRCAVGGWGRHFSREVDDIRKKTYTARSLELAVKRYFASISRKVEMTEQKDLGERDEKGHVILSEVPVVNQLGRQATKIEYLQPPTVGGLCDALGISRSDWEAFGNDPDYAGPVLLVGDRIRAYLEEMILTKKDIKGFLSDLPGHDAIPKPCGELSPEEEAVTLEEKEALLKEMADVLSGQPDG